MAKDVVKLNKATTVEGSDVAIASGGTVTVDNAKVIKTDINPVMVLFTSLIRSFFQRIKL